MPDRVVGGRYRLVGPLGRGGMAVVWRGLDELLGRDVAVKTLDLTGPDSEGWAARFRREARATAGLNHPNIVTVFDTGVEGHTAYLVMELLPGPTLAERVKEDGPLPIVDVRSVGLQMCAALAAAHAAGIVHRDIKPANVSYAADGTVKVLDFGITQLMDDPGHALTRTNTVMGTADYLAPEQALGGRVDARADLYALGCVLFALLTGEPPFRSETPVATMMRHAHDPAPDVREIRADTPDDLALLIDELLAKDAADRPANAEAVAAILRGDARPAAKAATEVLPTALPPVLGPTQPEAVLPPVPGAAGPDLRPRPVAPRRGVAMWLPWLLLLLLVGGVAAYVLTHLDNVTPTPGATTGTTSATSTRSRSSTTTSPPTTTRTTTTQPTTTTSTTTTTTTSPTTSATSATTAADPQAALSDLRDAVTQASKAGGIDAEAAKKLGEQLDKIGKALGNNGGKATKAVDDFGTLLEQLTADSHITPAGATALTGPYNALKSAVVG